MATTAPTDPVENPDPLDSDEALEHWMNGADEEIAAITPAEHRAAIDQILTRAGYHRDPDGHIRRPPAQTMGEPPTQIPHYLQYHAPRMWKGELEFTSLRDHKPFASLLITQLTYQDTLRVDWNGETIAELDRRAFFNWLRTGELGIGHNLPPFTEGQVTWSWKGPDLQVTITGIKHVFPATAFYELRTLAVR